MFNPLKGVPVSIFGNHFGSFQNCPKIVLTRKFSKSNNFKSIDGNFEAVSFQETTFSQLENKWAEKNVSITIS
jgi:hypothetical protein